MIAPAPHEDARYVALLRRYDEELRRGGLSGSTRDEGGPHETPPQAGNVLDCLHLLERVWPRASQTGGVPPVEQIGRFRIERVLGHGGFGIVYLATDPALRRQVALKVPRLHALSQPALVDRFRREARAAAGLDHPHIVPVYEAGEAADALYIASAYCPGPNLGQWLRDQPGGISPRTAALIVAQLADAVAYSHSRGVLHRDIKPGNVLLVPHENGDGSRIETGAAVPVARPERTTPVPFFYTPRLSDFGLAKVLEEAAADGTLNVAAETVAGAMLGTPAYMAPEQTAGGLEPIGPAADVYALGAVLYELLTGRPPFQGANVVDLLDQVRHAEPVPVRRLRRDVPRDLETICHKCLEKDPGRRYSSADELHADLERFQRGDPIRARPPGNFGLAWKWMRRRKALTVAMAACLTAILGAGIQQSLHTAALENVNSDLARSNTQLEEALGAAQQSERAAREVAYAADINSAWRARQEGDFVQFEDVINRYRDGTPLAEYRGLEWHYLERLTRADGRELLRLPRAIYSVALNDDPRQLTVVGEDAFVRIVDVASGRVLSEWDTCQQEVNSALYSPDGMTLWTSGDDGTVRGWDMRSHQETERFVAHPEGVYDLAFYNHEDPERRRLITCGREPVIRLWHNGACRETLVGHTNWVEDIELHPDGRRLVSTSQDGCAHVWDVATQRSLLTVGANSDKILHAAVSPDGKVVATCADKLHLWDADDGTLLLEHEIADRPYRVCFPFHDGLLCVADRVGVLHLFEPRMNDAGVLSELLPGPAWRAHTDRPYALVASRDGDAIVSAGKDGRVVVWTSQGLSLTEPRRIECPGNSECAFSRDGAQLVVAAKQMHVFDNESLAIVNANLGADYSWQHAAVSPRGDLLAASSSLWESEPNVVVQTWRLPDFSEVAQFELSRHDPRSLPVSFSADGGTLAAGADGSVFLLDPYTGDVEQQFDVQQGMAVFSPTDADMLVLQSPTHTLRALNWRTGATLWETAEMPQRPRKVVFTPDGRQLVSVGPDRTVRIWDAHAGALRHELRGHRAMDIWDVAVSPDGRTIASIDDDGALKFWHTATGQFLCDMPQDRAAADKIRIARPFCLFSPDGRYLAVSCGNDGVQLLPLRQ